MSLTSCLKKAGPHIHPDDKSQILMAARENRAAGMTAAAAAAKAVADSIGRVETMLAETLEVSAQDAPVAAVEPAVTKSAERQTDSPEFKAWFGNSRVVDAEGKPLVVYHGSGFDGPPGSYFTVSPEQASQYAANKQEVGGTPRVTPAYLSIQNPKIVSDDYIEWAGLEEHEREKLAGDGFDGMMNPAKTEIVAFKPEQIKSAIGNSGAFDANNADITKSAERAPIWYSQLQRAIEQVPERLATMAAPQWQQWLKSNAPKMGVKADELEWSGVDDYLKLLGKDKITSAELAQWVGANGVQVEETTLSENDMPWLVVDQNTGGDGFYEEHPTQQAAEARVAEMGENNFAALPPASATNAGRRSEGPKYSQYTLPGGTNYREVLLTLPSAPRKARFDVVNRKMGAIIHKADTREAAQAWIAENQGMPAVRGFEVAERSGGQPTAPEYKSSHWEQPNILAHIRLNDRTDADGKKVLFIEELQSDWGQAGKKGGFDKPTDVQIVERPAPKNQYNPEGKPQYEVMVDGVSQGVFSTREVAEQRANQAPKRQGAVPTAPFVGKTEAWLALGLKRVIKMAVDEGYDRVALVSGEQSAERYDLSKHIDQLSTGSVPGEPGAWQVIARKDGEQLFDRVAKDDGELADLVGKDMAAKIIERKGGVFKGLDLKVGGEGMRAFYDQIVPNVARDVLKKLGGDGLREVRINTSQDLSRTPADLMIKINTTSNGQFRVGVGSGEDRIAKTFSTRVEAQAWADEQVRSANQAKPSGQTGFDITDKMRERAADGVPMFSRERGADEAIASTERDESAAEGWQSPSASKFDSMVYTMQDKLVDTKRVVAAIKDTAGEIRDDLDVYLQEELFHGRAAKRTEDFVHLELEPLVEQMRDDDVNIAELDHFLHARHAREANALIARRNPEIQDGGSGMLNQDAAAYMAELPADRRGALEAAAAKVDAILKGTKKMLVDYQLESAEKVHSWGEMFEHYVPLMREDEGDQTGGSGTGQGFSIKGKEVKSRTGSTRKVVDILANISMQRERTIVRGEKNRVGQALVGLAQANPNPGFWKVDVVPTTPTFNPSTGLVENRADPMFKQRDNALVTKITNASGEVIEHAVLFSENDGRAMRMAAALKNLDAAQLEGFLGASAKITRYFASVNTQYNPVFGVVNLVRDVQDAMINLGSTELAGKRLEVVRGTPSALRGIYGDLRAERRGEQGTSEWAQLWEDFKDVGGQTGYRQLFATSNDRAEAIKKALDPSSWMDSKLGRIFTAGGALKVPLAAAQRGAKWIFDWLSDYNEAMENSVRLSAYKAGLDIGMSKERAASLAKNLTVNFNRKGQAAQQAGALYAFFNASAQGTARMARTLFTMETGKPKTIRLSALGKKVVYGGMLLGTMQALGLAAAGFGDDDPPEFVRNNNLIIPTGGKKYISIPMPMGFRILPAIGRISTEWVLGGFKNTTKRSLAVVALFADSFNPIGSAGLSMQTLAPTAFDPLIALTENKDFTGRPIAKTSSNRAVPGHELGRDTATTVSKWLSEAINTLTGGTRHTAGVVSPTPDQIDYLIDQVTGGVGRELSKLEQTGLGTVRGEDVPLYKIPLVGRFVGNAASQASESTNFYANAAHLNEVETEIKGLRKEGKFSEAEQVRMKDPGGYLITVANRAELAVQKLRKEKSELLKAGASREKVIALEAKITDRMASLNRAVEALKARGQ